MSYAQISDMQNRYDVRVLGDLVSDAGSRVTNLTGNIVLQAMLDDAAGMIDAAVMVSQRYAVTDLQGLTGQDQAYLFRLNCDLAYVLLVSRRGTGKEKTLPQYDWTQTQIQKLRDGESVFNVTADVDAGVVEAEFPTGYIYNTVDLLRDNSWPYFPVRRNQQVP